MLKGCVIKVTKDNNNLPLNDGISEIHSPATLITGRIMPEFDKLKGLNFGDYVQVKQQNNPTNTNEARIVGAIAMVPSGNGQGSWYFISLVTGGRVHIYQ